MFSIKSFECSSSVVSYDIISLYFPRKFSLSFCDSLSDESLWWIEQFKKLEYLQLKKGANFTNLAILNLLRNLRHMEGLGLRYLNLSECSSLSDECLHALSQRYTLQSYLQYFLLLRCHFFRLWYSI